MIFWKKNKITKKVENSLNITNSNSNEDHNSAQDDDASVSDLDEKLDYILNDKKSLFSFNNFKKPKLS